MLLELLVLKHYYGYNRVYSRTLRRLFSMEYQYSDYHLFDINALNSTSVELDVAIGFGFYIEEEVDVELIYGDEIYDFDHSGDDMAFFFTSLSIIALISVLCII